MARSPRLFDQEELDRLQREEIERDVRFNRQALGCLFVLGVLALAAALLVAYWATH